MPFLNPVLRGSHPHPSVCRVGDVFYLATGTMTLYPGVPIHHAKDLIHWRMVGHRLTRPAHFQLDRHPDSTPMMYAPAFRHPAGVFYMITTNVHAGGNFYVTARDPAGPWSDPNSVPDEGASTGKCVAAIGAKEKARGVCPGLCGFCDSEGSLISSCPSWAS